MMFIIFLFLNQFYQIDSIRQNVDQFNLDRDLRRVKRSEFYSKSKPGGVRSCYCKLRSSFPATINEEKLDFVCNCRRSSQYESLLFKQHKHNLDDDNYLPNSSIRSSSRSRSKYYRSKRNRDLKNFRFEFEKKRKKQKKKQRKVTNDSMMQSQNDSSEDQEPNSNETSLNEQSHDEMCTCNSVEGCRGKCEILNGCVCSNEKKNECWGSSCFKTKINLPLLSFQNSYKNDPQSELLDLIYFTNNHKNKANRLKKVKNMNHLLGNQIGESSMMSNRISLDYPTSILEPIHPVHLFSSSLNLPRTIYPSQQTIRSIILSELETSEQKQNGQCRCLHGSRCFGAECENLKGCICDDLRCYGKFCGLFKTPYPDHEQLFKNKQVFLPENLQEYDLASKPSKPFKYNLQIDDKLAEGLVKHPEYTASSKSIKCEKMIEEEQSNESKIKQPQPNSMNTNNKIQLVKSTNSKESDKDKDDKSLNAYQMKVIKLTPVSSSQLIEDSVNRDQNRIQSETISLMI